MQDIGLGCGLIDLPIEYVKWILTNNKKVKWILHNNKKVKWTLTNDRIMK